MPEGRPHRHGGGDIRCRVADGSLEWLNHPSAAHRVRRVLGYPARIRDAPARHRGHGDNWDGNAQAALPP